jgi:hypothetical protein
MESTSRRELVAALQLAKARQYPQAANELYNLLKRPDLEPERMQLRYVLGLILMEMNLYQVAAFQFVEVLRNGNNNYSKLCLDKLIIAADYLGDDMLLNYAISKFRLEDLPAENHDMVYFRMGESLLKAKKFDESAKYSANVSPRSKYYYPAKFNQGLAYLEGKQIDYAIKVFKDIFQNLQRAPVTNELRVSAQLALARSYYQKKDWENSLFWYRAVPRDSELWHDALFESSWALFMSARFRSTLSNFQSLHSSFYEYFYQPESLLLRSIVYLYICKYDELEKVLNLYEKSYGEISDKVGDFLKATQNPIDLYDEVEKTQKIILQGGIEKVGSLGLKLPFKVTRYLLKQGGFEAGAKYLNLLGMERKRLNTFPNGFSKSAIGIYAEKILVNRIRNAKISIGESIKAELQGMRIELRDYYEQASFIKYELINAKKEILQKKIDGKKGTDRIDEKFNRNFYVENGFEYYPFRGEFWLDEIGNYQYLGKSSCQ